MNQHVFIVGSKGIPASYGGYETFVDRLTESHEGHAALSYHVACKANEEGVFSHNGARCFKVKVPEIGPAQAIWYDLKALSQVCRFIEKNDIEHPIVYLLACRIGPFCGYYQRKIHTLGGRLFVNPDGHEWARAKWSAPVRRYWKVSEALMASHCDLLICDSRSTERYIHDEYDRLDSAPATTYISYGADVCRSALLDDDPEWIGWLSKHGLTPDGYYLVVGRFVPENNYETMIREFMESDSKRNLVIVTNVNVAFLDELEVKTHWRSDSRIRFVGTVYNREMLSKVRENARAYIHGHEVGGTNPSLLEALGATDLSLLLDVDFNREVGEDAALYWTKDSGSLSLLIGRVETMPETERKTFGQMAKKRVSTAYSWQYIASEYERLFLGNVGTGESE